MSDTNKDLKKKVKELENIVSGLLQGWKAKHPEYFKPSPDMKLMNDPESTNEENNSPLTNPVPRKSDAVSRIDGDAKSTLYEEDKVKLLMTRANDKSSDVENFNTIKIWDLFKIIEDIFGRPKDFRIDTKGETKGCGKQIRNDDSYGWINCGDILDEDEKSGKVRLCNKCKEDTLCECGHTKTFHQIDRKGICIHGLVISGKGVGKGGCGCKKFLEDRQHAPGGKE